MMKTSTFLKFWAPLAVMQFVISFEIPAAIAFISRFGEVKENLAIFTVVTSLALLLEGPIIQMLSLSTAMADTWKNYKRIMSFLLACLAILVSIHIFCAMNGPFNFIATRIMRLEDSFIPPARIAFILMLPWVPTIGLRRLWQGVLIKHGHTVKVSMITVIRTSVTLIILIVLLYTSRIKGCYVASIALSAGVTAGAISAYIFARPVLREQRLESFNSAEESQPVIRWSQLILFYLPLALTSFVTEADRPIIAAGISRGLFPIESLAIWSVVISFISLFRGVCFSTQEASIALFSTPENNAVIRKAVFRFGTITCAVCLIFSLIPQCRDWFLITVSGLTDELAQMSRLPLSTICIVLISFPVIAWMRAVNIKNKTTKNIGFSVSMNLVAAIVAVVILNCCFKLNGITIGVISYIAAMFAEALYLLIKTDKG